MKRGPNQDLIDASDALESLIKRLPDLSLKDKVDIAARNRAICKNAEALDKAIKDEIKEKLKNKEGTVLGELFKAVLKLVPIDRLDQKAFKEAEPDMYNTFVRNDVDKRVGFEPR